MTENLDVSDSLLNESTSGEARAGDVTARGSAKVDVGRVNLHAALDLERLTAVADAVARTVDASAAGEIDTPAGAFGGAAHAEGPSSEVKAGIGPDGTGATIGVSAGGGGVSVHDNVLG